MNASLAKWGKRALGQVPTLSPRLPARFEPDSIGANGPFETSTALDPTSPAPATSAQTRHETAPLPAPRPQQPSHQTPPSAPQPERPPRSKSISNLRKSDKPSFRLPGTENAPSAPPVQPRNPNPNNPLQPSISPRSDDRNSAVPVSPIPTSEESSKTEQTQPPQKTDASQSAAPADSRHLASELKRLQDWIQRDTSESDQPEPRSTASPPEPVQPPLYSAHPFQTPAAQPVREAPPAPRATQVSIGSIIVRAHAPQPKPTPAAAATPSRASLEAYLARRTRGKS